MKKILCVVMLFLSGVLLTLTACGDHGGEKGTRLQVEEVDDDGTGVSIEETGGELHDLFGQIPGYIVPRSAMGAVDSDSSGHSILDDYDGDGIPNDEEIVTNPAVADYPRIVARIAPEVVMEIQMDRTLSTESYIESAEEDDFRETINDSMEDRHYTQLNRKTTPYVVKQSSSESGEHSDAYGYDNEDEYKFKAKASVNISIFGGEQEISGGERTRRSENWAMADAFSRSSMSEKTVFEYIDHRDNLDRNGIAFTDEKARAIARNYRSGMKLKESAVAGHNAGVVSASLYLRNTTVNMPVRISRVKCSLTFRTPGGVYLGVKTFFLLNEDYSEFEQDIYGDSEVGPFVIVVNNLPTDKIKQALARGYTPQIHVVSYDMHRVEDSNYNPGTDNLKIVEETAKGRTAQIKIIGNGMREIYRVPAFDVMADGGLSAGISLKKALFNIFRKRAGARESWDDEILSVSDEGLRWKTGRDDHDFNPDVKGNTWEMFETTVKTSVDSYNNERKIEVIKRIGQLQQYNPFNPEDNPAFSPGELLGESELKKMKYWVILHNGRYFQGDINDCIWAGERYEIICMDVGDFNRHFESFTYTPLQTGERIDVNTRWNELSNEGEFARSLYMGKLSPGEVVRLDVDLLESRFLLGRNAIRDKSAHGIKIADGLVSPGNLSYRIDSGSGSGGGIPSLFNHEASGGVNSIMVAISDSERADKYRITVSGTGGNGYRREIEVPVGELEDNDGEIILCARTLDVNGSPLGYIPGAAGEGMVYRIDVAALGNSQGYPVETPSSSSGVLARVFEAEGAPSPFTFSAVGSGELVYVRIGEAAQTEYYRIVCEGPLNEGMENLLQAQEFTAGAGMNLLRPSMPGENISGDLLYRVRVYAHNRNSNGLSAAGGQQYINLAGDLYRQQRRNQAGLSGDLFQSDAVDLEVNFNDGSGWYRLRLEYNDTKNTDRFIDCRYANNADYSSQKFQVFFKAPDGSDGERFNVFRGGREEVDLYIRTVAEAKYRDTFWPVQTGNQGCAPCAAENPVLAVKKPVEDGKPFNFLSYWIGNPHSDATRIEESLADKTGHDFSGLNEGDFMLTGSSINDYFFSPLEKRVYSLSASIADSLPVPGGQVIDAPYFNVSQGNESVLVYGMDSAMADYFEIYYRLYEHDGHEKENPAGHEHWTCFYADNPEWASQIIGGLVPNYRYIVAVRACNDHLGKSAWTFSEPVMPFSRQTAPAPEGLVITPVQEDGAWYIRVANIHVPGQVRYQVGYGRASQPADAMVLSDPLIESELGTAAGPVMLGPVLPWERYVIRARAVQLSGIAGEWSQDIAVDIPGSSDFSLDAAWTDKTDSGRRYIYDWYRRNDYQCNRGCCDHQDIFYNYILTIGDVTGPENMVDFRIDGSIEYDESTDRNVFTNPAHRSVPFEIDWTSEESFQLLGPVTNRYDKYFLGSYRNFCEAGYLIQNTQLRITIVGRNAYGEEISSGLMVISVPDPQ